MGLPNFIIYFVTGGIFTTLIVALEESNNRLLSGFATLIPVFTLVAYLFIGQSKGGVAVGQHAWFVLIGTLAAWIPYMLTVALVSPHMSSNKAIGLGLGVFVVLAIIYLLIVNHYRLFN